MLLQLLLLSLLVLMFLLLMSKETFLSMLLLLILMTIMFGTGMGGFGFGYLVILPLGLFLVFSLVDAHALVKVGVSFSPPLISVVAVTQLIGWFAFSNAESVTSVLAFPLRGFIEPVLLFALIRWLLARVRVA